MKVEFNYKGHIIVVERGMSTVTLKIDGEIQKIINKNAVMNRLSNTTLNGEILSGDDIGDTIKVKIITGFFSDDAILYYNDQRIAKKLMFAI